MNDTELSAKLGMILKGDKKAFEDIYNDMKIPVFTVILRIVGDRSEAEDILQEVFVKLYKSPPDAEIRKPRAYIFQSARNLALDALRKRKTLLDIDDVEVQAESFDEKTALNVDVENALAELSAEQRQIVTLHINADFKFREIAEMMDAPLGTVLWRYNKAIGRLRVILGGSL